MSEIKTEADLKKKLKALGKLDDATRNSVVCSLIGHSKIQDAFFGYWLCGRCGDQLGDTLASTYNTKDKVLIGHNCEECRKNYKTCTWRDKIFTPDPFKTEEIV